MGVFDILLWRQTTQDWISLQSWSVLLNTSIVNKLVDGKHKRAIFVVCGVPVYSSTTPCARKLCVRREQIQRKQVLYLLLYISDNLCDRYVLAPVKLRHSQKFYLKALVVHEVYKTCVRETKVGIDHGLVSFECFMMCGKTRESHTNVPEWTKGNLLSVQWF